MYAASAIAANTVCRSAAGAAAPLFTQYMFDALGVGGGGSLIGGVAVVLAPIPFIFYKYGEPIRKRSKFAPTPEKPANVEQEGPREQDSGSDSSSVSSSHHSGSENTYIEGAGLDHVEKPDNTQEIDAGQNEKTKGDLERDLEKGEIVNML